jgi:hypothetical protein
VDSAAQVIVAAEVSSEPAPFGRGSVSVMERCLEYVWLRKPMLRRAL